MYLASYVALCILHALYALSESMRRLSIFRRPNSGLHQHRAQVPTHLAVALLGADLTDPHAEREVLTESLRRLSLWAGEIGVKSLSLYDVHGMCCACHTHGVYSPL